MTKQEAEAIANNPNNYPLSQVVMARQLLESVSRKK